MSRFLALWTILIVNTPWVAYACPVCFSAKDEANRLAFLGTTVFLTGLPIALIGGFAYWALRRLRAHDGAMDDQGYDADGHREPERGDPH